MTVTTPVLAPRPMRSGGTPVSVALHRSSDRDALIALGDLMLAPR